MGVGDWGMVGWRGGGDCGNTDMARCVKEEWKIVMAHCAHVN